MSPFAHRANGLVGAAYRIRTMYGEIICDGCHSTPAALNNYFMSKGPDYAIMISDALMAKAPPLAASTSLAATISPSTRTAVPIWTTARWPVPL